MTRGLFGPGTIVLGGGAVVLLAFLAVGFFLPTSWEAEAIGVVPAPPETVLTLLDSPEGWRRWTPWPDSTTRSGPERGPGATMTWDSREFGAGSFRIEEASLRGVSYSVAVAGASDAPMETHGTVRLMPDGAGTRVEWREEGDLGRNPLMGYWALSMNRAQSTELGKSLDRLAEIVGEAAPDSATSGSSPSR